MVSLGFTPFEGRHHNWCNDGVWDGTTNAIKHILLSGIVLLQAVTCIMVASKLRAAVTSSPTQTSTPGAVVRSAANVENDKLILRAIASMATWIACVSAFAVVYRVYTATTKFGTTIYKSVPVSIVGTANGCACVGAHMFALPASTAHSPIRLPSTPTPTPTSTLSFMQCTVFGSVFSIFNTIPLMIAGGWIVFKYMQLLCVKDRCSCCSRSSCCSCGDTLCNSEQPPLVRIGSWFGRRSARQQSAAGIGRDRREGSGGTEITKSPTSSPIWNGAGRKTPENSQDGLNGLSRLDDAGVAAVAAKVASAAQVEAGPPPAPAPAPSASEPASTPGSPLPPVQPEGAVHSPIYTATKSPDAGGGAAGDGERAAARGTAGLGAGEGHGGGAHADLEAGRGAGVAEVDR